jgi:hypothetical protein
VWVRESLYQPTEKHSAEQWESPKVISTVGFLRGAITGGFHNFASIHGHGRSSDFAVRNSSASFDQHAGSGKNRAVANGQRGLRFICGASLAASGMSFFIRSGSPGKRLLTFL